MDIKLTTSILPDSHIESNILITNSNKTTQSLCGDYKMNLSWMDIKLTTSILPDVPIT